MPRKIHIPQSWIYGNSIDHFWTLRFAAGSTIELQVFLQISNLGVPIQDHNTDFEMLPYFSTKSGDDHRQAFLAATK